MKTEKANRSVVLLMLLLTASPASSSLRAWAGDSTSQPRSPAAENDAAASAPTTPTAAPLTEDLGCCFANGKANKIARVYSADPLSVFVIFDGGTGGHRIPREELPPQLAARYPYEPEKAAAYRQRQAEIAAHQAVVAAGQATRLWTARENLILGQIEALNRRDVELQKEKNILNSLPPGNGRRIRARHISDEQQGIRERIGQLRSQLAQIQAQQDNLR